MHRTNLGELGRFVWFALFLAIWLLDISTSREFLLNAPYTSIYTQNIVVMRGMFLFTGPLFALGPYLTMDGRQIQHSTRKQRNRLRHTAREI